MRLRTSCPKILFLPHRDEICSRKTDYEAGIACFCLSLATGRCAVRVGQTFRTPEYKRVTAVKHLIHKRFTTLTKAMHQGRENFTQYLNYERLVLQEVFFGTIEQLLASNFKLVFLRT